MLISFRVFLPGMLLNWLIFTLYLYQANLKFYKGISALHEAGHRAVPNLHVLPMLTKISYAACGGSFYLFTAGIPITGFAMVIAGALLNFRAKKRGLFYPYSAIWSGLLLIFFYTWGISYIPAILFFVIPAVVYGLMKLHSIKIAGTLKKWVQFFLFFILSLTATAFFYIGTAQSDLFLRARDYLLLSNPPGKVTNDFYYRYSPSAAEAIKPLIQKQIVPVLIDVNLEDQSRLKQCLDRFGWTNTGKTGQEIIRIKVDNKRILHIFKQDSLLLTIPLDEFLKHPFLFINQISEMLDTSKGLRYLCFSGLIIGLPALVFLTGFTVLTHCLSKKLPYLIAVLASGLIISGTACGTLIYIYPSFELSSFDTTPQGKSLPSSRETTETLRKAVSSNHQTLLSETNIKTIIKSDPAEKYWLAKYMGEFPKTDYLPYLKALLSDKSINVQCAAIQALSRYPNCSSLSGDLLDDLIQNSPHWYVQQAAFREIKKCPRPAP